MMTAEHAVLAAILVCLAGGMISWLVAAARGPAGVVALGSVTASVVLVLIGVANVLTNGAGAPATFWPVPSLGFALRLHVDGLTAVFLLLAATLALPSALYSIAYLRHYGERGDGRYYLNFLLFLAAMYGLVSTTDMMWFFFVFWQLMTLPGYALIRFERANPASRRAANKYLWMMQIACVTTMLGAELLAGSGASAGGGLRYDFATVSRNLPAMVQNHGGRVTLAFALFLVGFGIKMGMWPFGGIWLPDAHPAAPSPVSAMLSGVMIKTGIYGLIRYFLWLMPVEAGLAYPLGRWGWWIAVLGTITLLTGTWQALRQEQSKRLLAFHSIGQIGYVLLGVGIALSLLPTSRPEALSLAALGLFGALFHAFNHAVFKGLLFLNAGSLLYVTDTQDLNRMGGLWRVMPWTGATALVAALAITGVPLFNGFASKWCLYVSAVAGSAHVKGLAMCGLVALLTSALTLASFIKFFGAAFLSPTSDHVRTRINGRQASEVGWSMRLPQLFLAVLCVGLGLVPALAAGAVQAALTTSAEGFGRLLTTAAPLESGLWAGFAWQERSVFVPLLLAVTLAVPLLTVLLVFRRVPGETRAAQPWLSGYATSAASNRYTAHHYYGALKRVLARGGGPAPGGSRNATHQPANPPHP
jgi:formate hydrogenlyase subunit 3/multisubunit Na+/H+ antiporter MnhD subunit